MLHIKQLTKTFGQTEALRSTDLHIKKGEFVAILGPSGCGKSTLLRMLSGITPVTSGTIEMAGRDITQLPPEKRGIGMVFQSYALFPHMTVRQNLAFGLKMQRVPAELHEQKIMSAVAMTNLSEYLDRYPRQLSGGQQQLVGVARAIVGNPKLLLADEPTGNLHSEQGEEIMEIFQKLNKDDGITIVQVTHSEKNASYGDRIIRLVDGAVDEDIKVNVEQAS